MSSWLQGPQLDQHKVLCITFGAPPSTLQLKGSFNWQTTGDQESCLFWNFLLAENKLARSPSLLDVMPAVMTTIPKSMESAARWVDAIVDVLNALRSNGRNAAQELKDALQDLGNAGEPPVLQAHMLVHSIAFHFSAYTPLTHLFLPCQCPC